MRGPHHELIDLDDAAAWDAATAEVAHGPAHTHAMNRAYRATTGLETRLYRYERDGDVVICPLALRAAGERFDVTTPPGFNGFAGRPGPTFAEDWRGFATEVGWLAAYVALHPALFAAAPFPPHEIHVHNRLYLLDLTLTDEELERRMSRNRRRQLAGRPSAELVQDRGSIADFLVTHHEEFFDRRGGAASTRLVAETLRALVELPGAIVVGAAGADGLEAALVAVHTAACADAVVNVSVPGGERHGALLNAFVIRRLRELGLPVYNMGGGLRPGDSIAESKRRFGAVERPLTGIRQVFDPGTYARLCAAHGVDPLSTGYFPAYRAP